MKEKILSVQVLCDEFCPEVRSKKMRVVLVPFTGEAFGPYFNGKIIGPGVDTQKFSGEHEMVLSARYMLEGKDHTGQKCRIFIENTLHDENGWHPIIVTDSQALAEWEDIPLSATVDGAPGGVLVQIYKEA